MSKITHNSYESSSALLIMDMTNAFLSPGAAFEIPKAREMVPKLNSLIQICRKTEIPIVHCRYAHDDSDRASMGTFWPALSEGVLDRDSVGHEVLEEIDLSETDLQVHKSTYSAFHDTELEYQLRAVGVKRVIVSGCATNYACYLTAREAQSREFDVIFLSDGTAAFETDDAGYGKYSADLIQNIFLSTLAFGCAEVLTIGEMIERIEREFVETTSMVNGPEDDER